MEANLELVKRNDVLSVNDFGQQSAAIAITTAGFDCDFAILFVMGAAGVSVICASAMMRIFFYITAAVNFTACVANFTMGSNLSWAVIDVEWHRPVGSQVHGPDREIFYARYIDWVITTPLLLMDLLLTAGLPWPTTIWTVFLNWIMIVTGLVGPLVWTRHKWVKWKLHF